MKCPGIKAEIHAVIYRATSCQRQAHIRALHAHIWSHNGLRAKIIVANRDLTLDLTLAWDVLQHQSARL
jgi:hypothetical protein